MSHPRASLIIFVSLAACLADNPDGFLETDDTSAGSMSDTDGDTDSAAADSLLGCEPGQTCNLVFVSQTLDDRVEIFGGRVGDVPSYRGAIDFDLKPGVVAGMGLDEPYGIALSDGFLHVVAGHYPTREAGTMVSFPRSFFEGREVGERIAVSEYFAGGVFMAGAVGTPFADPEPIFVHPSVVQGRLLVGTFNNDLFSSEDAWMGTGQLSLVDAADPTQSAAIDLGDCIAAGEVEMLEDEFHAAVACDGNEAVAFLELGTLDGPIADAAAGITATICDLPQPRDRRVRHLAFDGVDGVYVTYGPSSTGNGTTASAQLYQVNRGCTSLNPVTVGDNGLTNLGEVVPFGQSGVLVASGTRGGGSRGIFHVTGNLQLCDATPGFEEFWSTPADDIDPYGIAVAPDGNHLAVGAGPVVVGAIQDSGYGRVLWATLSGVDDPCTMTAEVVDLTDGTPGRAPAPDPADPTTTRQAPQVVVIQEVQG